MKGYLGHGHRSNVKIINVLTGISMECFLEINDGASIERT